MVVMAPKNKWELEDMMEFALSCDCPVAIRYPKGEAYQGFEEYREPIRLGKSEVIYRAGNIAILAVGDMVKTAALVLEKLKEHFIDATLVNVRFVSPLDSEMLDELSKDHNIFITIEDNVRTGGFGQMVSDYICRNNMQFIRHINFSLPDCFIEQGEVDELLRKYGMDADSITEKILESI